MGVVEARRSRSIWKVELVFEIFYMSYSLLQPITVYSMLDLLAMKLRGPNGSKPFD